MLCLNMCRCLFSGAARGRGVLFKVYMWVDHLNFRGWYPMHLRVGQSSLKSTFPRGTRLISKFLLHCRLGGTPLLM